MKTLTKALFVLILSMSLAGVNVAQTQAPQAKLLITNALLLTMVPGQEKPFTGYIVVGNDETITAIGTGSPPSGLSAIGSAAAEGFLRKRPSGGVAPQSKTHQGYSPSSRLAIRPLARIQAPLVVSKQALRPKDQFPVTKGQRNLKTQTPKLRVAKIWIEL